MFSTSASKWFYTVPQHDPQSIHHSMDELPMHQMPSTYQREPSIMAYEGYNDDTRQLVSHTPLAHPLSHVSSRPRRSHSTILPWKNPCSIEMILFLGDIILTIAPSIFLVLVLEAMKLDHQPISERGKFIEQAAKLGPTVFPIIFAAVVGRLMRCYALWRAERGSSLGILEQLNGSQNLLAAFERALLLPGLGFLSLGVVLLWALSPVGGQSSLRILSRGTDSVLGNHSVYYFDTTGNDEGAFVGSSSLSSFKASMNAVFQASMTSLQLVNGSDVWGNIKIPVLDYVDNYQAGRKDGDGWYAFNETTYSDPYSALNGIVVSNLQMNKETNFSMESSYYNLSCTEPAFFDKDPMANGTAMWGGFAEWVGNLYQRGTNESLLFDGLYGSSVGSNSYMIDTNYNKSNNHAALPKYNYIYASKGISTGWIAAYNCTVGLFYIESQIHCTSRDCHVEKVRPSRKRSWSSIGWPFPSDSITPPALLLNWLGTTTSLTRSGVVSPIDRYISGGDNPFEATSADVTYKNVSGAQFAKRLQSLVNTGWQLSFLNSATAQQPPSNLSALQISTNRMTSSTIYGGVGYPVSSASAVTTTNHEVFVTNKIWIFVTVTIASILLFCGIAGLYFRYGSRSPDILGYVSSMTRDNPSFEPIPDGDKLDGLERARVMRHIRVQIADVRPWNERGHITLRNLGHRVQGRQ